MNKNIEMGVFEKKEVKYLDFISQQDISRIYYKNTFFHFSLSLEVSEIIKNKKVTIILRIWMAWKIRGHKVKSQNLEPG